MNKIIRLLSIAICCIWSCTVAYAQTEEEFPKLKELKGKDLGQTITPLQHPKSKLWGYANREGKYVIKPVFAQALPFEGNFARIQVNGKWGLINSRGLYQYLPKYDGLEAFSSDSLAVAKSTNRYGLVNVYGKTVLGFDFDSISYASYGYMVKKFNLIGTVNHVGKVMIAPIFTDVTMLDKDAELEQVQKDGKWGFMRHGSEVSDIIWDDKLVFFQSGSGDLPDLYTASMKGKKGIATINGKLVIPCIYDRIEKSTSGEYYITQRQGLYGAFTLKMSDLIPPILESKPFIGDNLFRIYNDGRFFCANVNGCIKFEDCADLYSIFKPEEYLTTKYFPQWAKTHLIDENLLKRQAKLDYARELLSSGVSAAIYNEEKYGLNLNVSFNKSSGYSEGDPFYYKASEGPENESYLLKNALSGDYSLKIDDVFVSLSNAFAKYNVKKFNGFYPLAYARVSDSEVALLLSFVRSIDEANTPLVETNSYLLPVDAYEINVHMGLTDKNKETHAVCFISLDKCEVESLVELNSNVGSAIIASQFGGFYICKSRNVLADSTTPLVRYDKYGNYDWTYQPVDGETILDIEETENYIYLCSSVKTYNNEATSLAMLSKRGELLKYHYTEDSSRKFTKIVCKNYLIYTDSSKENEYIPSFNLEDMGDNVGVRPSCVWDEWGTGSVGGLGLIDETGMWLQTPMLSPDQMCTSFDWEFSGFSGDYLIVRHMGYYGLVNREGVQVVDTKYDNLEALLNPRYFRVMKNGRYGVINAEGKVVVPLKYAYVGNMSEDIIIVSQDGVYGTFDKDGREIIPIKYDNGDKIEEIREYVGGMSRIRYKGRFGFIDKKGEEVVAPFSDEVENFSEGYTLVTIKKKKGVVSLQGDWIAPPMYDAGGTFSDGLALLGMGGKYGYIDKTGDFAIAMQYQDAKDFDRNTSLACVAKDGKWGVINKLGKVVLPFEFDKVTITSDKYLYVESKGKVGIYNNKGVEVLAPICDRIDIKKNGEIFNYGVAEGFLNDERIRIDELGNIVYQYSLQR